MAGSWWKRRGNERHAANEGDPDISEELEKMEAAMDNYPKANTEKLVNDNEPAHKELDGN